MINNRNAIPVLCLGLTFCLIWGLSGCGLATGGSYLKKQLICGFDGWMQNFSRHALTKEQELQGEKSKGKDTYTGSYTAIYEKFNGEEIIFGGTALERRAGNCLTVTYTLKVTSGEASLNWLHDNKEHIIAEADGNNTFEVTLGPGDNYILLRGEDFQGSLELSVE